MRFLVAVCGRSEERKREKKEKNIYRKHQSYKFFETLILKFCRECSAFVSNNLLNRMNFPSFLQQPATNKVALLLRRLPNLQQNVSRCSKTTTIEAIAVTVSHFPSKCNLVCHINFALPYCFVGSVGLDW